MKSRMEMYVLPLVMIGGLFLAGVQLMVNGFSTTSVLQAALCLAPLLLTLLVIAAPIWAGLGLGAVGMTFGLPLPVLERMEIGMLILGLLILLTGLNLITRHHYFAIKLDWGGKVMIVATVLILARFVYDRPGSANLGSFGGLGEASAFVLGALSYFVMVRLGADSWRPRMNLWCAAVMLFIGLILDYVLSFIQDPLVGFMGLFNRQMWFLSPMVLAWAFERGRRTKPPFGVTATILGVCGVILALGIISPHRSRPLFAIGIILSVAWVYNRSYKVLIGLSVPVAIFAAFALTVGIERVPFLVSRSLSTLLPIPSSQFDNYVYEFGSSSENGWTSPFRQQLWGLALEQIDRHPLAGKGFAYSAEEVNWALSRSGAVEDAVQGLAVSGCYHNALAELAVFCGLPAAFAFLLAYIRGVRAIGQFSAITDPHMRILVAGILGFFVATSGQMLMNGSGRDFFYVCVVLGAMQGIRQRLDREALAQPASENPRVPALS